MKAPRPPSNIRTGQLRIPGIDDASAAQHVAAEPPSGSLADAAGASTDCESMDAFDVMERALEDPETYTGCLHDDVPTRWQQPDPQPVLPSHSATLTDLVDCEPGQLPGTVADDWKSTWTLTTSHDKLRMTSSIDDVELGTILRGTPRRSASQHPTARSHAGVHYVSSIDESVPHQSLVESNVALVLDYLGVTKLLAQPFTLNWHDGQGRRSHTPDYLCELDGRIVVIDVRPRELLDDEIRMSFNALTQVCNAKGWFTCLAVDFKRPACTNLFALNAHNDTFVPELQEELLDLLEFEGALSVTDLEGASGVPMFARAVIQNLIWQRLVSVNLNKTLTSMSIVHPLGPHRSLDGGFR